MMFPLFIPLIVLTLSIALSVFIHRERRNYKKSQGQKAEQMVVNILAQLPQDEYLILNDLMLPTKFGTTQIDHVVLSTHGIYVIETKCYSGSLIGNEKSEQWEQNINGFRFKTGNALRQNKTHISAVRFHGYINKDVPIHNIVVFSRKTDFHIYYEHGEIIYIDELIPTILRLSSEKPIYTIEQVRLKANILQQHNITDTEKRLEHNAAANAAKYERKGKIEAGICPRCGGQLIERKGKYSTFYGCLNFPECDFTIRDLRTSSTILKSKSRFSEFL